jgi:hypothetical protein
MDRRANTFTLSTYLNFTFVFSRKVLYHLSHTPILVLFFVVAVHIIVVSFYNFCPNANVEVKDLQHYFLVNL